LTADKPTLKSVDGTDDAQLIVTVVDRTGRALINSPPVTLTIESGPGEFPTGPSITFDPNSDIAIRNGAAAMEFRSYYSGRTVIRATSPGLADATITINSLGEPEFIAGKTPPVKPRPYVRFEGQSAPVPATPTNSGFGFQNPTQASSEAPGHNASLGNDGNAATFWQAGAADSNAWWSVDLERMVTVSQTRLTFPAEANWRYRIEISNDGSTGWKLVADQTQNTSTDKVRTDATQQVASGRFLRVTFTGVPSGQSAALAEMEVVGRLATP
jgi:hypothetical protein